MMASRQQIDPRVANHLLYYITGPSSDRAKAALQEFCRLYRRGYRLQYTTRHQFEVSILGQLNAQISDEKLRRWCLNALSLIGSSEVCIDTIKIILERFQNDPDTMSSAVTAYFQVEKNALHELRKADIVSEQLIVTAAIVGGFYKDINVKDMQIDIDTADPIILRNALLAIGLDNAPANIFHPNYTYPEIIGSLGGHDDAYVAQYSVWAVTENPSLSVKHLGVDTQHVQDLTDNVRAWVYRVFAEEPGYSTKMHDLLVQGSSDRSIEARRNLATGARDTFYDGKDTVIMEWFFDEDQEEIRDLLNDHMAKNSERSLSYDKHIKQEFLQAGLNSPKRNRILALAHKTKLFSELRKIELQSDTNLLPNLEPTPLLGGNVTNNTYNIGNIQSGAVAINGDAKNDSKTTNALSMDQNLHNDLQQMITLLETSNSQSNDVLSLIDTLKTIDTNPSKENLSLLKSALTNGNQLLEKSILIGENATKFAGLIEKLSAFIT